MSYKVISPIMNYFLTNNMAKDYTSIEGEKCQLVQLVPPTLGAFQQPFYFDSMTMLDGDNCTITGIELIPNTKLVKAPNGDTPLDTGLYAKYGVLVVSDIKRQIIAQLPLSSLITSNNAGKIKFTNIDTHLWENCYVEFMSGGFSSPTIPLQFNIYYVPKIKN